MAAVATEWQRLEPDLHDGAQQKLVAVGMRLRSLQHQLGPHQSAHGEIDRAVDTLESTVAELRRITHGIRPSRLDAMRRVVAGGSALDPTIVAALVIPTKAGWGWSFSWQRETPTVPGVGHHLTGDRYPGDTAGVLLCPERAVRPEGGRNRRLIP
jgi:Histidine kinase